MSEKDRLMAEALARGDRPTHRRHGHECPKCGHRWWHDPDACRGEDATYESCTDAHVCSQCGTVQREVDLSICDLDPQHIPARPALPDPPIGGLPRLPGSDPDAPIRAGSETAQWAALETAHGPGGWSRIGSEEVVRGDQRLTRVQCVLSGGQPSVTYFAAATVSADAPIAGVGTVVAASLGGLALIAAWIATVVKAAAIGGEVGFEVGATVAQALMARGIVAQMPGIPKTSAITPDMTEADGDAAMRALAADGKPETMAQIGERITKLRELSGVKFWAAPGTAAKVKAQVAADRAAREKEDPKVGNVSNFAGFDPFSYVEIQAPGGYRVRVAGDVLRIGGAPVPQSLSSAIAASVALAAIPPTRALSAAALAAARAAGTAVVMPVVPSPDPGQPGAHPASTSLGAEQVRRYAAAYPTQLPPGSGAVRYGGHKDMILDPSGQGGELRQSGPGSMVLYGGLKADGGLWQSGESSHHDDKWKDYSQAFQPFLRDAIGPDGQPVDLLDVVAAGGPLGGPLPAWIVARLRGGAGRSAPSPPPGGPAAPSSPPELPSLERPASGAPSGSGAGAGAAAAAGAAALWGGES
jgi:hypothetical protein